MEADNVLQLTMIHVKKKTMQNSPRLYNEYKIASPALQFHLCVCVCVCVCVFFFSPLEEVVEENNWINNFIAIATNSFAKEE